MVEILAKRIVGNSDDVTPIGDMVYHSAAQQATLLHKVQMYKKQINPTLTEVALLKVYPP